MAGSCTGVGIRINAFNEVEADVDRRQVWPYTAQLASKNGLRGDPETGQLWAPPDQIVSKVEAIGVAKTIIPTDAATVALTDLTVTMTASTDHDQVMFGLFLSGGKAGFRMGTGNFWLVNHIVTTYDNGTPTTFTGSEDCASAENNAGGSIGFSLTPDALIGWHVKPGGTVFKVTASYSFDPLTFTDSPTNGFAWRPPRLHVLQLSMPQAT